MGSQSHAIPASLLAMHPQACEKKQSSAKPSALMDQQVLEKQACSGGEAENVQELGVSPVKPLEPVLQRRIFLHSVKY